MLITFVAGLLVAMALNSPDLRALRFYRVLIVLPYAMPSFAMLLVWRDMFNQDFGLDQQAHRARSINWFGEAWTARAAILLIQFWLGYPYMFLVCLGALQSIPKDLTEAAAVDGAQALPGVPGGRLPAAARRGRAAAHLRRSRSTSTTSTSSP